MDEQQPVSGSAVSARDCRESARRFYKPFISHPADAVSITRDRNSGFYKFQVVPWLHGVRDLRPGWLSGLAGLFALEDYEAIAGRIDLLSEQGPATARPTVDTIEGSRHSNMKELRCGKNRVLFAFDPLTQAVLLIGGNKEDRWQEWYVENIPVADELYGDWLMNLKHNPDWANNPDR